tara:strand:+ start:52785 stop:53600 length:816 start_codon:yes stop_codon:yes gene_type:complete
VSKITEIRSEEARPGILQITLDGAATRNSIGRDQYDALRAALVDAGTRTDLRAVVLTGAGGFFSSGGNVSALKQGRALPLSEVMKNTDSLGAMILALRNCPLPVIGAVEGGAAGLGLALALSCDMLVASETAKFTAAYVKIGLTPDGGTTHFLREALPRQLVSEMCLLGRPMPATRLHQAGTINTLAPEGGSLEAAMELAIDCARGPRTAMGAIKAEIEAAPLNGLAAQLDLEARGINAARYGDEAGEGLAAFLEKRAPNFSPNDREGDSR